MAARRPHPKSKLGCAECKRRRIKCDESRPDCEKCRRRGIVCSFRTFDPTPNLSTLSWFATETDASRAHTFSQRPDDSLGPPLSHGLLNLNAQSALLEQFPEPLRPRFLETLRHFAANTIPTLNSQVAAQAAWRDALPTLATNYKFVTHGILAIGSLHLARLVVSGSERETYENVAATQMNLGMTQYRVEVQSVTTKNAEALFAFSTMITTFVLLTAGTECNATLNSIHKDDTSIEDKLPSISTLSNAICRIFRSIRGVLVIIVPCWNHIQSGTLRPVLEREWWPPPVPVTPEEIDDNWKLRHLETMWSHPGRTYEYSFDTLRIALKALQEGFALVSRLTFLAQTGDTTQGPYFDWTSIIHWPVLLPLEFISLLEQRCMEAWVLVAHYAMLMARVTDVLWLDGLAPTLVMTAALVVGEDNWEWIVWPAATVDVDLKSLRNMANISHRPKLKSQR